MPNLVVGGHSELTMSWPTNSVLFSNKSGSFLLSSTVDVDAQFRRSWAFGIDYVLAHQLSLSEKEKQFSILIFPSYIFPSNFSEKGTLESTVSLPLNAVLLELRTTFKGL